MMSLIWQFPSTALSFHKTRNDLILFDLLYLPFQLVVKWVICRSNLGVFDALFLQRVASSIRHLTHKHKSRKCSQNILHKNTFHQNLTMGDPTSRRNQTRNRLRAQLRKKRESLADQFDFKIYIAFVFKEKVCQQNGKILLSLDIKYILWNVHY